MTYLAFVLIFVSVFLHCGWNLLLRGHSPSLAFLLLLNFFSCLLMLPFLFLVPLPFWRLSWKFWLCLVGSVAGELLFNVVLVQGYKCFDLSLVYPLMRALPVGMLALASRMLPLGRKVPSEAAICGMSFIFAGCLCMSLVGRNADGEKRIRSSPWMLLFWSILGALGTCLYTCFDNQAATLVEASSVLRWGIVTACAYFVLIVFGLSLGIAVMVAHSPSERRALKALRGNLRFPLLAGLFNVVCYSLVLLAYSKATNAALVFACRQLGLPISFLAGVFFLHEKATLAKITGLVAIAIGLLLSCL